MARMGGNQQCEQEESKYASGKSTRKEMCTVRGNDVERQLSVYRQSICSLLIGEFKNYICYIKVIKMIKNFKLRTRK